MINICALAILIFNSINGDTDVEDIHEKLLSSGTISNSDIKNGQIDTSQLNDKWCLQLSTDGLIKKCFQAALALKDTTYSQSFRDVYNLAVIYQYA
jgi:hypothetical protein